MVAAIGSRDIRVRPNVRREFTLDFSVTWVSVARLAGSFTRHANYLKAYIQGSTKELS
jgi:hypothetical protein